MSRTLVLPTAPGTYNRAEEQINRDRIRQGIEGSLGNTEIPVYPGVPLMLVNGTNATWSAPASALTKVPFNTVITNSSLHTFSTGDNTFTVAYGGTYRFYSHMFHNGGGAIKKVDIAVCIFKNGVEALRNTVQRELDQIWNAEGIFIAPLIAGDVIDLRVGHTETVSVVFDLTFSRMMLEQMTPDPTYKDRTRL